MVLALDYLVTVGILPNVNSISLKSGCKFGAECSFPHWKVEEQPKKKPKKGGDKSAVAMVKSVRQSSCVSQDTEPPNSVTISWKGTKVLGPIRRVRFTRAALRQANIRENKGPSLKKYKSKFFICEVPPLRNLRTDLQKRLIDKSDAPSARHGILREIFTSSKKRTKLDSIRLPKKRILPAASTIKPEEREFVVDS